LAEKRREQFHNKFLQSNRREEEGKLRETHVLPLTLLASGFSPTIYLRKRKQRI
jgi:hypothetical protein